MFQGKGFLTPPELHFVRNHGPVPRVQDDDIPDWELSIEGLVDLDDMCICFFSLLKNEGGKNLLNLPQSCGETHCLDIPTDFRRI